jgi:hypothetical protein
MVLNVFSLVSLFVGIISLVLVVSSALSALFSYRRFNQSVGADEKAHAISRMHLSFLLLLTAFLLRIISWPLFYIQLQSLIPVVPGAMCIYGVTRVMPVFIKFMEIWKPFTFFLISGWMIFYSLDISLRNRPLMKKTIRFLVAASVVAAIDILAELFFIFVFSPPGIAVSCCTALADITIPASPLLPTPLLNIRYHHILFAGYHGFNLCLIVLTGFLARREKTGRVGLSFVALIAIFNCIITCAAFKEFLGPRLMHLPDHNCLYCMLQYRPISFLIIGLFIAGSFFALWPPLFGSFVRMDENREILEVLIRRLFKYAAISLFASWVLTNLALNF